MSGNAHQRRIILRACPVDNTAALAFEVMRRFTVSAPPEAVPNLRAKFRAFFMKYLQRLGIARANRFGV